MHSYFKSLKLNWLFIAVLFISFVPTLFFRFQYHNDLGYWLDREFGPHPESGHLFYFGRSLGGILLDLHTNILKLFPTLTALTVSRFVSLIFLAVLFYLVEKILTKYTHLSAIHRTIFLLILALQPSWFEAFVWTSNLIPGIIAYILAVSAFLVYPKEIKTKWSRYLTPAALLASSFLIYPPGACSFFWGPFILCCFGKENYKFKKVIFDGLFFCAVCVLCLIFHKLVVAGVVCDNYWAKCATWEPENSKEYSWAIITNPLEKLGTLWNLTAITTLSWSALITKGTVLTVLPGFALFVFAFGPDTRAHEHKMTWQTWARGLCYSLMFLLIFNAPNLVTHGEVIAFRTVAANTIFFSVGLIKLLSLIRYRPIQNTLSILIVGVCVGLCIFVSTKFANHLQTAWKEVITDAEVRNVCTIGPKVGPKFAAIPAIQKYLKPSFANEIDGFDLDLQIFLQDMTPSICYLLENE